MISAIHDSVCGLSSNDYGRVNFVYPTLGAVLRKGESSETVSRITMQPATHPPPIPSVPPLDPVRIRQRDDATTTRVRELEQAGFRCVPVRSENKKQLAYSGDRGTRRYEPAHFIGKAIAIRTGKLADGSYLCRLDIDQHKPDQNAEAALEHLLPFIDSIPTSFAYRRSTLGHGYDVIFRSPRPLPNNDNFYVNGVMAGQVFCEGGRIVDDDWIAGAPEQLAVLTEHELAYLLNMVLIRGTNATHEVTWQYRVREGRPLIQGYRDVDVTRLLRPDDMPKVFEGDKKPHQIAQRNWWRLKTARKGERSEAYAAFVQSLMLLANRLSGQTLQDKCRVVAAIAITNSPRDDKPRDSIENDTAALIARILHGDAFGDGEKHFLVPSWASEYQPAARPAGRPAKDRQSQLNALRRLIANHAEGDRVEYIDGIKLTVKLLAKRLRMGERMAQRYLAQLEENGEITRSSVSGRGGRLVIVIQPGFSSRGAWGGTNQRMTVPANRSVDSRAGVETDAQVPSGMSREALGEDEELWDVVTETKLADCLTRGEYEDALLYAEALSDQELRLVWQTVIREQWDSERACVAG